MLARGRPSSIDSIVSVLAAFTAVMVLVVVVSLGLQGRLGENAGTAPSFGEDSIASPVKLEFDDLSDPISVECRSVPGDTPGQDVLAVTLESGANERRDYEVLVELLASEGPPAEGYALLTAVEPGLAATARIALRSQPGVATPANAFSACRVVAIESGQRVLRAD